jgi:hypothetical protein
LPEIGQVIIGLPSLSNFSIDNLVEGNTGKADCLSGNIRATPDSLSGSLHLIADGNGARSQRSLGDNFLRTKRQAGKGCPKGGMKLLVHLDVVHLRLVGIVVNVVEGIVTGPGYQVSTIIVSNYLGDQII